jgi:hypothetical protein
MPGWRRGAGVSCSPQSEFWGDNIKTVPRYLLPCSIYLSHVMSFTYYICHLFSFLPPENQHHKVLILFMAVLLTDTQRCLMFVD